MEAARECACKAARSCAKCLDPEYRKQFPDLLPLPEGPPTTAATSVSAYTDGCLPGLKLVPDFLSEDEEHALVQCLEADPNWKPSQSGRSKIDYGPQVNFKKQKIKMGDFKGLPAYAKSAIDQIRALDCSFEAHEMSVLSYQKLDGASLAFHFDDFWIWGERIYGINLVSDTVLTFQKGSEQIEVPIPRRSLYCMSGASRYEW